MGPRLGRTGNAGGGEGIVACATAARGAAAAAASARRATAAAFIAPAPAPPRPALSPAFLEAVPPPRLPRPPRLPPRPARTRARAWRLPRSRRAASRSRGRRLRRPAPVGGGPGGGRARDSPSGLLLPRSLDKRVVSMGLEWGEVSRAGLETEGDSCRQRRRRSTAPSTGRGAPEYWEGAAVSSSGQYLVSRARRGAGAAVAFSNPGPRNMPVLPSTGGLFYSPTPRRGMRYPGCLYGL